VSHDEFDNADSAPVPPYERQWRHPSEAGEEARLIRDAILAPPPLSRRIALATITVSIVCSLAILAVTVPKGVAQLTADDSVPETTLVRSSIATKVKNATAAVETSNASDSVHALAVGDSDLFIAPGDTINSDGTISITTSTGEIVPCHVLARDDTTGLVVISMPESDLQNPWKIFGIRDIDAQDEFDINDLSIIEPISGLLFAGQLSISTDSIDPLITKGAVPLDVDIRINGVSVVVNKNTKVVGVAFTRNHSTWMLPMKTVRKLINDARVALQEQLQLTAK
jgi:hypothetical protein